MLNAKIFYIFLCLIVIETTGLLLLKRGLEMGYLDTEAIILAVFSFAFYNLCSFAWVCSTIKKIKNKQAYYQSEPLKKRIFLHLLRKCVIRILRKSDSFLSHEQWKSTSSTNAEAFLRGCKSRPAQWHLIITFLIQPDIRNSNSRFR